jgi:hypothetical protein
VKGNCGGGGGLSADVVDCGRSLGNVGSVGGVVGDWIAGAIGHHC